MTFKIFLFTTLIIFSLALKDKDKDTIYKAMSELKPALQKEACQFIYEYKDEEGDKHEEIYMKPCKEGYHCGQKIGDISHCIPNVIHQKYGEKCNYDNECIVGSCDQDKQKCTFVKDDKAIYKKYVYDMWRCGSELIYSNKNNKCVDKSELDYVEGYCLYTKNEEKAKEVDIQPNHPFYVCGEEGIADEKTPQLKQGTKYIKMSKIGSLKSGTQTYHELACEFGTASRSKDGESWICDKIEKFKGTGINEENNKPYIQYQFFIAGEQTIVDDYEDYIYLNKLNGAYAPYTEKYNDAFKNFKYAIKDYGSKCKSQSHDYYFKPYDCGIKEISDALFYLYNFEFYINKTEEAKTVMNAIKQEDFDKISYGTSNILSFKIMPLVLISLLSLL